MSLESLVASYGYAALFLGTLLEGETVLILAGIMAHLGLMKLPLVMLVALLGSFLGDQFYFFLGRKKGDGPSFKATPAGGSAPGR